MLSEKVAIVTGASRGIGRAIAKTFAAQGASVAINFHNSQNEAEELLGEIEEQGGKGILVKGDVSRPADVRSIAHLVALFLCGFGGVKLLEIE